ncbi:MAG: winged helix-turn-helix domain-containing protein [Candidatus Acidiferrales bacterium]
MNEEIGKMAGEIWHTLEANGEMTLAKLKKELNAKSPLFDWAIGWLAREDKIVLTVEKRSVRVCLKGWHTQSVHAA